MRLEDAGAVAAALRSSFNASSSVQSLPLREATSGTSSVNSMSRSALRRMTSWRRTGVEAVRLATINVRRITC